MNEIKMTMKIRNEVQIDDSEGIMSEIVMTRERKMRDGDEQ